MPNARSRLQKVETLPIFFSGTSLPWIKRRLSIRLADAANSFPRAQLSSKIIGHGTTEACDRSAALASDVCTLPEKPSPPVVTE